MGLGKEIDILRNKIEESAMKEEQTTSIESDFPLRMTTFLNLHN